MLTISHDRTANVFELFDENHSYLGSFDTYSEASEARSAVLANRLRLDAMDREEMASMRERFVQQDHTKAEPAPAVEGKPAWHGFYRVNAASPWVRLGVIYGPIAYTSPEAACRAASYQRNLRLGK